MIYGIILIKYSKQLTQNSKIYPWSPLIYRTINIRSNKKFRIQNNNTRELITWICDKKKVREITLTLV